MALVEVVTLRQHYRPGGLLFDEGDHYFLTDVVARERVDLGFVKKLGPAPRNALPYQRIALHERKLVAQFASYYVLSDGTKYHGAERAGEALGISAQDVKDLAARTLTKTARIADVSAFEIPEVLDELGDYS